VARCEDQGRDSCLILPIGTAGSNACVSGDRAAQIDGREDRHVYLPDRAWLALMELLMVLS
jgi:hypothetical protein